MSLSTMRLNDSVEGRAGVLTLMHIAAFLIKIGDRQSVNEIIAPRFLELHEETFAPINFEEKKTKSRYQYRIWQEEVPVEEPDFAEIRKRG